MPLERETPLHLAAVRGHTETAVRIVELGADVNARDNVCRRENLEYRYSSGKRTQLGISGVQPANTLVSKAIAEIIGTDVFFSNL